MKQMIFALSETPVAAQKSGIVAESAGLLRLARARCSFWARFCRFDRFWTLTLRSPAPHEAQPGDAAACGVWGVVGKVA